MSEDEIIVLTKSENVDGIDLVIGQTAWIPFMIQLPPVTVLPLEVGNLGSISSTCLNSAFLSTNTLALNFYFINKFTIRSFSCGQILVPYTKVCMRVPEIFPKHKFNLLKLKLKFSLMAGQNTLFTECMLFVACLPRIETFENKFFFNF